MLGDAADDAVAPPTLQASGGAPSPLAGAKKSLGDPGGPSKWLLAARRGEGNYRRNLLLSTGSQGETLGIGY
jgi:hypothetical protein